MVVLAWNPLFLTRLGVVDGHHEHLFILLNRLEELTGPATAPDLAVLGKALAELTDYTVYHFGAEEGLMDQTPVDPRHVQEHRREHQEFIQEIQARSGGAQDAGALRDLHAFLVQWLVVHILHTDRSMARQILAVGEGLTPGAAFEAEAARSPEHLGSVYLEAVQGLHDLLVQRNQQLLDVSRTLEQEVARRTQALDETNSELLRTIAALDDNRRSLQQREQHLASLFNDSPVGHALNRLSDGAFIAVNAAFARITGRTMEELNALSYWDVTPREYEAREQAQLRALQETGHFGPYEKEYCHRDGHRVPVILNGSLVRGPEGEALIMSVVADITERKRMEQALRTESLKNAAFLRNGSDGIHILDLEGHVVEASDSFCALLGYAREEVLGMHVSRWDAQYRPEDMASVIQGMFAAQARTQFTTLHRRKDGTLFEVEISGQPVEFDGRPLMFYASRDITERRNAERRIIESEQFVKHIADIIPGVVTYWGPDERCLFANAGLQEYFGIAPERIVGQNLRDVLDGASYQRLAPYRDGVIRGETQAFERPVEKPDGTVRTLWTQYVPDFRDGRLAGVIHRATDITELKEAQRKLAESEQFLRGLSDAVPGVVGYWDRDLTCRFASIGSLEYFGRTPEAMEGLTALAFFGPEAFETHGPFMRRALAGERVQYERNLVKADGTPCCIWVHLIPDLVDGACRGFFSRSLDVTALKTTQAKLERMVAKLRESNTDLEQFAFIASHDLRAPLRAIESLSEWLEEDLGDNLPEASAKNLKLLRGRARRMESLLDGILAFSRSGRAPLAQETVDVLALVEDIVDLDGIAARADLACGPLPVFSTAAAPLRQVLQNLIANAVKHHDGPRARIRVEAQDRGEALEFSVADDGPGIPEQDRERVFGLFQTLRPRDEVEGSGIGLAVVRKIVRRFGGQVRVEAAGPRGTVMKFTWLRALPPDLEPSDVEGAP